MRVLLVDDEPLMLEYSASVLTSCGFEVQQETNGDDALECYLELGPYDLVLTDYIHPGMDGIELAAAIRRKNAKQAIALVTAATFVKPLPAAVKDIPVLEKPWQRQELLELVRSTLESCTHKAGKHPPPSPRKH